MPDPISARETVLATIVSTLATALAPVVVQRSRRSTPDASEAPLLIVYDLGHKAAYPDAGETSYELSIGLDGTVAAASDDLLGPALNDLYARALAALMADPTLGGVLSELREDALEVRLATSTESDAPLAFFSLDLVAEFRTPDGQPFPA